MVDRAKAVFFFATWAVLPTMVTDFGQVVFFGKVGSVNSPQLPHQRCRAMPSFCKPVTAQIASIVVAPIR